MFQSWMVFFCAFWLLVEPGSLRAAVYDSYNADLNPRAGYSWSAYGVGWAYTPTFSYDLNGVLTKFGSGDSRTVTLEIYDGLPTIHGYPPTTFTLLRAVDFTPVGQQFSGGEFAPLSLQEGHQYFIGFKNVDSLYVNYTADPGASSPGYMYFGWYPSDNYGLGSRSGPEAQPILEFTGVPEPRQFGWATIGLLAVAGLESQRRKWADLKR